MSSLSRNDFDVEMSGVAEETNNNTTTTERMNSAAVQVRNQEEVLPAVPSDAFPAMDFNSSDPKNNIEPGIDAASPSPPAWSFDILVRDEPTGSSDTPFNGNKEDQNSELEEGSDQWQAAPVHMGDTSHWEFPPDAQDNNQADRDAVDEDLATEAVADAVAEEVRAQEQAANQANAQDWLAEQDRWLNQLANDNPEEFNRLMAAGVIDPDFVPQPLNNGNNDAHEGDNDEDSAHGGVVDDGQDDGAVADGDEQAQAPAAPFAPGPAGIAASNPPSPAQTTDDGNAGQAPNTDHFVWLANRADAGDENTDCPSCLTPLDPNEQVVYLTCGHAWCGDCLNANYRSALRSRANWPPQCCGVPIATETIAELLETEIQVDIIMKGEEFTDSSPIYCQTPKCLGGYIPPVHRSGLWAACQTCHLSTCVECRAPQKDHPMPDMHPSIDSIIQAEDKTLADGAGWKQCPGCRNLVERTDGCDHMMCECGESFCYKCGGSLHNGMPCECQGTPEWVEQMRREAEERGAAEDSEGDDSEEDGEDEDEDGQHGGEDEERHEEGGAQDNNEAAGEPLALRVPSPEPPFMPGAWDDGRPHIDGVQDAEGGAADLLPDVAPRGWWGPPGHPPNDQ